MPGSIIGNLVSESKFWKFRLWPSWAGSWDRGSEIMNFAPKSGSRSQKWGPQSKIRFLQVVNKPINSLKQPRNIPKDVGKYHWKFGFWEQISKISTLAELGWKLGSRLGNPGFSLGVGLEISKMRTVIENRLPTSCKQTHELTKTAQKHPQRCREVSLEICFLRENLGFFRFGLQ